MYVRLQPLVKWPRRDELRESLPMDFRADFQKCAVIIDCLKFLLNDPQTWWQEIRHGPIINTIIPLSFSSALHHKGLLHSYLKDGQGGCQTFI